jgi:Tfp pilus assembly protein FimV
MLTVAVIWLVLGAASALAQPAPEVEEPSSAAPGILVVIGGAALLAAGLWLWLRDDGEPDENDDVDEFDDAAVEDDGDLGADDAPDQSLTHRGHTE